MACKTAIGLVHNQNAARLSHIRPHIQALVEAIDGTSIEVWKQPGITPVGSLEMYYRDLVSWFSERTWECYLGRQPRPLYKAPLLHNFIRSFRSDIRVQKKKRLGAIEKRLTNKHIEIWEKLKFKADYIIVMEDDACFQPDSIASIQALLTRLQRSGHRDHLYVDLAGGLKIDSLSVDKHIDQDRSDDALLFFKKPVTNTTCAYLISSKLAQTFSNKLSTKPWYGTLPADWLINMLLVDIDKDEDIEWTCIHARPSLLNHGSITGEYVSDMRSIEVN